MADSEPLNNAVTDEQAYKTRHGLDLDVRMLFAALISFAIIVFGITIPALQAWVYNAQTAHWEETVAEPRNSELADHELDQRLLLGGEVKIDEQAGTAKIPIEDAIPLFVAASGSPPTDRSDTDSAVNSDQGD